MGFFEKIRQGLTRTKESIGHSFDQLFAGELDDDFYDTLEAVSYTHLFHGAPPFLVPGTGR